MQSEMVGTIYFLLVIGTFLTVEGVDIHKTYIVNDQSLFDLETITEELATYKARFDHEQLSRSSVSTTSTKLVKGETIVSVYCDRINKS